MRYAASEKLEIIRTVETSILPVRRTLDKIGIPGTTSYAWLDRYAVGGLAALEDHRPRPRRVWNRIPDGVREFDSLEGRGMNHTRGKPCHPMTQGKIERWPLSLKSRILLENYDLPVDLERAVTDFVEHCKHRRYDESLHNLTPADAYFGRGDRILKRREDIERRKIYQRRRHHFNAAA
jgi:putative transposase